MLVGREAGQGLRTDGLEPPGAPDCDREDEREECGEKADAPVRDPRGHGLPVRPLQLEVPGRLRRDEAESLDSRILESSAGGGRRELRLKSVALGGELVPLRVELLNLDVQA
jgi:hypothetical protein